MSRLQSFKNRPIGDRSTPVLARVFKGSPKTDAKKPGSELDYFRVEFEDSPLFDKMMLQQAFVELYGDKPQQLPGVFFTNDKVDTVFPTAMEEWAVSQNGTPSAVNRCDGRTNTLRRVNGEFSRAPVACNRQCKCKPTGRLKFWLPEFSQRTGIMGQFMLTTHAQTDIEQILPTLDFALENIGRLTRVAFLLYRKPEAITTPDGITVTKHLVRLELMSTAAQQAALNAGEIMPMLPPVSEHPWSEYEAKEFVNHWRERGYSNDQILAALNISRLSEWRYSRSTAMQRMENHQ